MKVYVIAGEASGDVIGSLAMRALRMQKPGVAFYGIGGPLMEAEGLRSLFPVHELSVMGIAEVLPRLKHIIGRIAETIDHINTIAPDIVLTIDSPDFCFRVTQGLRRQKAEKMPVIIHYVAPTVWAWRENRALKISRLYDGLLCLFPFEPPYFTRHNLPSVYVGHPVVEQGFIDANGLPVRESLGISADAKVVGLLFGSRNGEVERHGQVIAEAARRLQKDNPGVHFLVPTLPHIEDKVRGLLDGLRNVTVTSAVENKSGFFAAMDGAVAVSGTVGLELAVANVPHVILYRMNALTFRVIKAVIRVRFAHLANILLNKEVVPELIQQDCTPEKIVQAIRPLLKDGLDVDNQCAEFASVRKLLHGKGRDAPSAQAAQFILDLHHRMTDKTFVPYAKAG